ncbi:MAG: sulfatase [Syntrophothermus sp.]
MSLSKQENRVKAHGWRSLFILTLLVSYFFVFMEWVFFVTKPSFMSAMSLVEKLETLFVTGGVLAILSTLILLIPFFIDWLFSIRFDFPRYLLNGAAILPALILSLLVLLLLDNFTYTIFKYGIVTSRGIFRAAYIPVLLLAFLYFYRFVLRFINSQRQGMNLRFLSIVSVVLLVIPAVFVLRRADLFSSELSGSRSARGGVLPNILILGSDGLNADHLSLYGYERDTTPNLTQLADKALVAENAFPNAGNSAGSVTSILTGKLPTVTRVVHSPNILMGSDAYQHLPGILRNVGYYTAEIGVQNYVDSYDVNMQDGFDLVNQRSIDENPFFQVGRKLGFGYAFYFLPRIYERVADRILHIFFIRTMDNSFKLVTEMDGPQAVNDQDRVNQLLDLFAKTKQPLFVHVHLMGTHGPKFFPHNQVYSANQEQNDFWMNDFYDDAILDFDGYIKEIFNTLAASGKLDNTIVVIYTDHNERYHTTQRIPLLFFFPRGEQAGKIQNNVQNLDIAPTLLDYLGISIPQWMSGQSLLKGEPPRDRLIFSAISHDADPKNYKPPFNQFSVMGIVDCDQWYEFHTLGNFSVSSYVKGHTHPCGDANGRTLGSMKADLLDHLQRAKFQVASLPTDEYEALPNGDITHGQASIFILKTLHGSSFSPPPARGLFEDVPSGSKLVPWIEELYREGIDEPCSVSPLKYCPDRVVTRKDAAIFILKAVSGAAYAPPPAKGIFSDVPASSEFAPWIEELYKRGITAGCVAEPPGFCPDTPIDLDQFAILLYHARNKQ